MFVMFISINNIGVSLTQGHTSVIFLGSSAIKKGYKCDHPPSKKMLISIDVTFVEDHGYYSGGEKS